MEYLILLGNFCPRVSNALASENIFLQVSSSHCTKWSQSVIALFSIWVGYLLGHLLWVDSFKEQNGDRKGFNQSQLLIFEAWWQSTPTWHGCYATKPKSSKYQIHFRNNFLLLGHVKCLFGYTEKVRQFFYFQY